MGAFQKFVHQIFIDYEENPYKGCSVEMTMYSDLIFTHEEGGESYTFTVSYSTLQIPYNKYIKSRMTWTNAITECKTNINKSIDDWLNAKEYLKFPVFMYI